MQKSKSFFKSETFFFIVFVLLSAVGVFINLPYCYDKVITYDSAYQYSLTVHSWKEIWRLLPEDYSPPLYTVILKLVCIVFGHTLKVMRFTNSIVIIGLVFLALFPIRKAFGIKTAIVSAAAFLCSSLNSVLFNEVRPTYWAYFFLTATAVYAYLAFFEGNRKYYICHTFFSLCSMYTHNVAMVGALGIYIVVLLFAIIKKDKKKFIRFFISGTICAVLYLPWLIVLFKQLGNVTDHYWKGVNSTFSSIREDCVESILFCIYPSTSIPVLVEHTLSLLFKLLIIYYLIKNIKIKDAKKLSDIVKQSPLFDKEKKHSYFKMAFILLLFLMPLLIFEILARTVYQFSTPRYYYLFTGIIIIILSLFFTRIEKRIIPFICIAALITNTVSIHADIRTSLLNSSAQKMVETIKKDNPDGDICFLHSHEWSIGIMSYFFPNAKHYIYDDTFTVINDMSVFTTNPQNIGNIDNIRAYTDKFYTFNSFFTNEEKIDPIKYFENEPGYTCQKHKRYNYLYTVPSTISISKVEVKNGNDTSEKDDIQ